MDLSTTYLGMKLRSPLVPSAAQPLTENVDNIKRMEDAGAAAVVMHSLFEEQLSLERRELFESMTQGTESFAEALTYFPEPSAFHVGPELYLKNIAQAKAAVKIPVIASLNGSTTGGWVRYAKEIEQAGADVTMLCSVILRHGPKHIRVIESEMRTWLEEHEYESVQQLQGSMSQKNCPDPAAFERAQYMRAIASYKPT